MQPLVVVGDLVRCMLMDSASRNGMCSRNPRFTACKRVCSGGLKNAWCMYVAWFCICVMMWALWAHGGSWGACRHVGVCACCVGVVVGFKGRCQRFVKGSCLVLMRTRVAPSRTEQVLVQCVPAWPWLVAMVCQSCRCEWIVRWIYP